MTFNFTKKDKINDLPPNILDYMDTFIDHRFKAFEELEQAVKKSDFEYIRGFCHNQIGVAACYRCFKLEEIVLFIQDHAKTEEIAPIAEAMPAFKSYLTELKTFVSTKSL